MSSLLEQVPSLHSKLKSNETKSIGAEIDICTKPFMKIDESFLDIFK